MLRSVRTGADERKCSPDRQRRLSHTEQNRGATVAARSEDSACGQDVMSQHVSRREARSRSTARAHPAWLRDFFPGYFALVMATGIVAVAARLLRYEALAWGLFWIALPAYPLLWLIQLARLALFPRLVIADLVSHERGPAFLTIVAATGVLGTQFDAFGTLRALVPALFWLSAGLWALLVYGFLSAVTVRVSKPDLEHGLNGAWLLIVVATESLAVLSALWAQASETPPALVFTSLALYLLGSMLYVLLAALIFFRWIFRPMHAAEMGAPWWINMGAVAIATLAGAQLMALRPLSPELAPLLQFVATFTVLLWSTSTFWIPLLVILFIWKEMQRGPHGYDPGLWSAVFPLGMYAVATHDYAQVARLPFLEPLAGVLFWIGLFAWALTFIGMWVTLLRREPAGHRHSTHSPL
jgi:tellurite resistance protein TehA-like permease